MEVFSTSRRARTAFTVEASISSAPLKHTGQLKKGLNVSICVCLCPFVPGGQQLCVVQVQHHVQEVAAPENATLQQQEAETDAVPDDAGLVTGQLALLAALLLGCRMHTCTPLLALLAGREADGQKDRQVAPHAWCSP